MAWPFIFANLGGGNQPLSDFDAMFTQVAAMVQIPCTATGTNSITLAPIGNAPSSTNLSAYGNFNLFSFLAAGTSSSSVTAQFGSLANIPVYRADGTTQATSGDLVSGRPYGLMYASSLNSGGGGFYLLRPALQPSGGQATQQIFLTGTAATYTTPANCLQLRIRMVGGGASGGDMGGGAGTGNPGTATIFNAIAAAPGAGGTGGSNGGGLSGAGGAGGTGGAGAATLREPGQAGNRGFSAPAGASAAGGQPGSGSIGSAGQGGAGAPVGGGPGGAGAGGGAGEYVELVINNPVATYTYTVGTGGAIVGNSSAGLNGIIYVEERYQD